ncbi:MAG: hypothetical protein WCS97_02890 [Candidatus Paceibacterota bacterium]|jgi:dihydroorotate dehydrogenase
MKGIKLSNDYVLRHVIASGALAFDGKGWPWEKWLVWMGRIKPELFAVVLKTLTLYPEVGNFCWWKPWTWLPFSPWSCVKLLPNGGAVNKVGLTNDGFIWWRDEVAPKIDFDKYKIIVSIKGTLIELVAMAGDLNRFNLVAIEINPSCPNTGKRMPTTEEVIESGKAVKKTSRHPIIIKASCVQDYCAIAEGLNGYVEAISLNTVPIEIVYPGQRSPLWRLEKKVGGGGGGISGKPAQEFNWPAVGKLVQQGALPVICPDIMEFKDIEYAAERLGAEAVSYGTIHFPTKGKPWTMFTNPCKPTRFVEREMREEEK